MNESRHYHVLSTVDGNIALASTVFDSYEDSVDLYARLSVMMFGHLFESGKLAIEEAKTATENGEADGAYVGNEYLALVWLRCQGLCSSVTWN